MKIRGRCECGATRYEIASGAGLDIANCHCRTCRRSTGGTYVTWATVARSAFRWTGAKPRVHVSNPRTKRYFCGSCGAQLALVTTRAPETIDVTVATFADADRHRPTRNIWMCRKLGWVPVDRRLRSEEREEPNAGSGRG